MTSSRVENSSSRAARKVKLALMGPAFVAAIGYIDPGNFATNIQAGASFGYQLLWVVVWANLMAMLIQVMSAKLGIATGKNLAEQSESELRLIRRNMGMIFQNFNLLMQKTVLENVQFPLDIQGIEKAEGKKRAQELLTMVGLEEKEKAYPVQLSGGQKQRVAIARALASNPEVLLLDEATSALDPKTTVAILELLKEIQKKYQVTIVLITHEMEVVKAICNKVAILEDGYLVEEGSVECLNKRFG